tara:strand:- start:3726 stop:4010 length:285 start_codon:yes stop_codon:yes gene_type:complete
MIPYKKMNNTKGVQVLILVILCIIISYLPKIIGNDEYKSDIETIIESITLDQTLPLALVILILGLLIISLKKECKVKEETSLSSLLPSSPPSYK